MQEKNLVGTNGGRQTINLRVRANTDSNELNELSFMVLTDESTPFRSVTNHAIHRLKLITGDEY